MWIGVTLLTGLLLYEWVKYAKEPAPPSDPPRRKAEWSPGEYCPLHSRQYADCEDQHKK